MDCGLGQHESSIMSILVENVVEDTWIMGCDWRWRIGWWSKDKEDGYSKVEKKGSAHIIEHRSHIKVLVTETYLQLYYGEGGMELFKGAIWGEENGLVFIIVEVDHWSQVIRGNHEGLHSRSMTNCRAIGWDKSQIGKGHGHWIYFEWIAREISLPSNELGVASTDNQLQGFVGSIDGWGEMYAGFPYPL